MHTFPEFFFETYVWNSCKKNAIVTFDYIINRNINFPNEKIRQFLASKSEHTDDFLCLNTEHTKSFLHSEPNIPNLAKPNIPKLSYFLDQTYRQFLSFETDHTEQTEHADHFLRRKPNIPNISCVVFVRSSQLGRLCPAPPPPPPQLIFRIMNYYVMVRTL